MSELVGARVKKPGARPGFHLLDAGISGQAI
jgi:hypothetical protein